jgi:hypothetical protein
MPRRAIEYSRSVLAYHAGLRCGLDGLADHGRRFIQIFDNDIALFDVISLGRKYFPKITEDAWFSEYLTNKIMTSFEAEEGIFQQEASMALARHRISINSLERSWQKPMIVRYLLFEMRRT